MMETLKYDNKCMHIMSATEQKKKTLHGGLGRAIYTMHNMTKATSNYVGCDSDWQSPILYQSVWNELLIKKEKNIAAAISGWPVETN